MSNSRLRAAWLRTLSAQLGNPSGLLGGLVAKQLNKNNATPISAAVDVLASGGSLAEATVADVGFGGGLGLSLLLGTGATVHGVEPSASMITRAQRGFGEELAAGRLTLHLASMDDLPFDDGELDGWITLNTVYFVDDLGPSRAELARVLSPTGVGVVGVADPDWMRTQDFAQQGFTVRPLDDVVAQLGSAGLAVERRGAPHEISDVPYHLLTCRHRDAQQDKVVSASRVIQASAATIFELIADPEQQPRWDGNDNLDTAAAGQRVHAVGDVFEMTNTSGNVRQNHVVEFEEGHLVAWRPSPVDGPQPGHLWRWELEPVDDTSTRVTHTYDWTQLTDETRFERARSTTTDKLQASVDRLAELAESL